MDNNPLDIKSPIFTPNPGWGGKLKIWIRKNWGDYILPALAVTILIIGLLRFFDR